MVNGVEGLLRGLRSEHGKTQADFAAASGFSASFFSRLERGKIGTLDFRDAQVVCRLYGISPEELFMELGRRRVSKPRRPPATGGAKG